eukprot:gene1959-2639_t
MNVSLAPGNNLRIKSEEQKENEKSVKESVFLTAVDEDEADDGLAPGDPSELVPARSFIKKSAARQYESAIRAEAEKKRASKLEELSEGPGAAKGSKAARKKAQDEWLKEAGKPINNLHPLPMSKVKGCAQDRAAQLIRDFPNCGNVLRVSDPRAFASEVCPVYFRHRNWTSFTRMMNLYSFRMLNGTSRAVAPDHARTARFVHPHFTRDDPDRLWRVVREKRRPPAPKPKPPDASAADALLGLAAAAAAAAPAPAPKRPADDASDSADGDNQEPKRPRNDRSPTCSAAQIDLI